MDRQSTKNEKVNITNKMDDSLKDIDTKGKRKKSSKMKKHKSSHQEQQGSREGKSVEPNVNLQHHKTNKSSDKARGNSRQIEERDIKTNSKPPKHREHPHSASATPQRQQYVTSMRSPQRKAGARSESRSTLKHQNVSQNWSPCRDHWITRPKFNRRAASVCTEGCDRNCTPCCTPCCTPRCTPCCAPRCPPCYPPCNEVTNMPCEAPCTSPPKFARHSYLRLSLRYFNQFPAPSIPNAGIRPYSMKTTSTSLGDNTGQSVFSNRHVYPSDDDMNMVNLGNQAQCTCMTGIPHCHPNNNAGSFPAQNDPNCPQPPTNAGCQAPVHLTTLGCGNGVQPNPTQPQGWPDGQMEQQKPICIPRCMPWLPGLGLYRAMPECKKAPDKNERGKNDHPDEEKWKDRGHRGRRAPVLYGFDDLEDDDEEYDDSREDSDLSRTSAS